MSAKNYHFRLDVSSALRNRSFDALQHDDGRPMSRAEAKAELESLLARGINFIPCGDCEGFDPEHGCPGHPVEDSAS